MPELLVILLIAGVLVAVMAKRKESENAVSPGGERWVCQTCGHTGVAAEKKSGSGWITFVLVWFMVVPAIIYEIWRSSTKRRACANCGSEQLLSADIARAPRTALSDRSERPCPHCAEPILAAAKVCKHCGRDVAAVV
jgi:ribosomal protein S27AE